MLYYRRGKKEISLKTKDFKEAQKVKRKLEASGSEILTASLSLRLRDIEQEYLDSRKLDLKGGKIRAITLAHSEKYLKPIMDYFGKQPIAKIDSVMWESFKKTIDGNTIVNIRSVFGHLIRFCIKRGYRSTLPIFSLDQVKRRKRRILTPVEMAAIWTHSTGSLRLFISLALRLGLRRSEIMRLEWDQVNFVDRAIFLPEHKTKTKRDRWVTLPDAVVSELRERKASQGSGRWVFPHLTKRSQHADLGGLKTAWRTCLRKAFNVRAGEKLPNITWHDLRATAESYAHKRTDLSATQLEKFFGASVDVQRKIYVQGGVEFVRGVENSLELPEFIKHDGEKKGSGGSADI
jgi:integrase